MLNALRWVGFIPVSTIVAMTIGFNWSRVFPSATYSESNLLISVIGLGPKLLGQALPVGIFIILATIIAPKSNRVLIVFLGLAAGSYGMPLELVFPGQGVVGVITATEIAGAIAGIGLGMIFAFKLSRNRKTLEPNPASLPPTT